MPTQKTPLSSDEIVAEHFPLHGPYERDLTVKAVYVIDGLVRYLNYATTHAEAMPWPAALYDLVGVLGTAVQKMPQTMQQTGDRLHVLSVDPEFVDRNMDYYSSPAAAAAAHDEAVVKAEQAHDVLQHAGALAAAIGDQLSAVQNLLSPLGMITIPDDDEDED